MNKAIFVWVVVAVGCSSPGDPPLRREVVADLVEHVMLPTFVDVEAHAGTLATATSSLCAAEDTGGLAAAREAWRALRQPWGEQSAFAFGPIEDEHIETAIDFWPARIESIEGTLADQPEPTAAAIDALGVTSKGLPVIEYLLFDPARTDAQILASLAADSGYRCRYAAALADDASRQSMQLRAAWAPAFAAELADGGELYPTAQDAVDEVLNNLIFALQEMTDAKLGRPLGDATGGTPKPEATQSPYADHAIADLTANLAGVAALYEGRDGGMGLGDAVVARNADLDDRVRAQLQVARDALAAFAIPLRVAVVEDPGAVAALRDTLLDLRRLFEVDVANVLGVTLTLSDNDGD